MIQRMKLGFPILSDENQLVQKSYGVQNPDTEELALHAVFIVNADRRVVYRKIAGRRPLSQELLDAIDHARGEYPLGDHAPQRGDIPVAFPTNNFQTLLELANAARLPQGINGAELNHIIQLRRQGALDEATIAYKAFVAQHRRTHTEQELLSTAAWLTRQTIELPSEAVIAGQALSQALLRERQYQNSDQPEYQSSQQELEQLRGLVRNNARNWRLGAAKSTLRGYRELTKAAYADL